MNLRAGLASSPPMPKVKVKNCAAVDRAKRRRQWRQIVRNRQRKRTSSTGNPRRLIALGRGKHNTFAAGPQLARSAAIVDFATTEHEATAVGTTHAISNGGRIPSPTHDIPRPPPPARAGQTRQCRGGQNRQRAGAPRRPELQGQHGLAVRAVRGAFCLLCDRCLSFIWLILF